MKKRMSKKLLAAVLAILLVFSALPFGGTTSFAAATAQHIEDLHTAITDYLTKMTGGVIYDDMKAAYNAYIDAYKLYDAAKYGSNNVNDSDVVNATNTLNSATNAMDVWTGYTYTSQSIQFKNAVPQGDYNEGILWAEQPAVAGGYEKEAFQYKFAVPRYAVMLYDGGNIKVPAMIVAGNMSDTGAGNYRMALGFYVNQDTQDQQVDNEYFQFAQPWNGRTVTQSRYGPSAISEFDFMTCMNGSDPKIPGYTNGTIGDTNESNNAGEMEPHVYNNREWWMYSDYMQYQKDAATTKGFTNGLQTVAFSFNGASMRKTTVWSYSSADWHYYFSTSNGSNANWGGRYYVIDATGVVEAISAAKQICNFGYTPATYNTDGTIRRPEKVDYYYLNHELDSFFNYIDLLQKQSLTGFTSSNYSSRAATVASAIKTNRDALKALNNAGAPTDETAQYQALREVMDMTDSNDATKGTAREVYTAGNTNDQDATLPKYWTNATWTPFQGAYSDALAIFDAIPSGGYSASGAAAAETKATGTNGVRPTYLALKALANFLPIDEAIQYLQNKASQQKDTNYRYLKSDLDAIVAKINNASTYPYLQMAMATRVTYDKDSDAAIASEAAAIRALADSDLSLDNQIDISALTASVDDAKATLNGVDPDAYDGIETAKQLLDNYQINMSTVTIPGTCTVSATTPEACAIDQSAVDATIANYLSNVHLKQYTVTINGTPAGTYDYGTTQSFDSPTGEAVDWSYEMTSSTSNTDGKVQTATIQGQSTIELVIKGNVNLTTQTAQGADAGKVKITYRSSLGKVFDVQYVAPNATVNPDTVAHPNYAGYDFIGYNTSEFAATEDKVVIAKYEATSAEAFSIGFVNTNGSGNFANPSNAKLMTVTFNTRMEFSADQLMNDYEEIEDEDTGDFYVATTFNMGGDYKEEDDYTPLVAPERTLCPDTSADYPEWTDDNALYAVSMVPEAKYSTWRNVPKNQTGRNYIIKTDDETGEDYYDTTAAPNTERLLAVAPSESLDDEFSHVWYAQESCYLVFYTKDQFIDAVKANVFEGIDPSADPAKVAATYAYEKTTRVVDSTNGEKNHLDFRGTTATVPSGAQFIETGIIFSYAKNATAAQKTAVQEAELTFDNVSNAKKIYRIKMSDAKLTRRKYNTGYQFAMQFLTKDSTWSGATLDIKYRTYVNYKVGNTLKTVYSDEITPSTYNF